AAPMPAQRGLRAALRGLYRDGLVEDLPRHDGADGAPRYALTPAGLAEARRVLDETAGARAAAGEPA
ncbi:MAG: hypothetical protein RID91_16810, partial [Azospirillaceae bacterium]